MQNFFMFSPISLIDMFAFLKIGVISSNSFLISIGTLISHSNIPKILLFLIDLISFDSEQADNFDFLFIISFVIFFALILFCKIFSHSHSQIV